MRNKQYKKYFSILAIGIYILTPHKAQAVTDCTPFRERVAQMELIKYQTQTGGTAAVGQPVPPAVTNLANAVQAAADAHCTLGAQYVPKNLGDSDGTRMLPNYTAPAPGDSQNTLGSNIYSSGKNADVVKEGGSSNLPIADPSNVKVTAGTTVKTSTPAKTAANNASTCGNIAAAYGTYLSGLTGADTPTYKAGCAGTNPDNTARTSPDNTGQTCAGNQFGQFGLVQAAYNNKYQTTDVSSLATASPSAPPGGTVVASKNNASGATNEPNGCRLSNYSTCGQVGDVILVQSKPTASATTPYDTYLIYAGDNQFYHTQSNGDKAVVKSSLPPEYSGASYAAVREPCSSDTAAN